MEQNRKMYGEIIKEREYRKLIFATVINRFGDSVDAIAFTWLVYQITHSAAWSAIVYRLQLLFFYFHKQFVELFIPHSFLVLMRNR